MGIVTTDDKNYKDIAEAIRGKTGKTDLLLPSQMAGEISGITGGGESVDYSSFAWKRPSTWIPLPEHDTTKDEIFMVMSVPDEGSFYAFTVNTPFTVSWGDVDNTVQSFAANEIAKFEFTVDNVAETYFDELSKERQALIKIQADKGSITGIYFAKDDELYPDYPKNIIEIVMYLVSCNAINDNVKHTRLISYIAYGYVTFTSYRYVLGYLSELENIKLEHTENIRDFSYVGNQKIRLIELDCTSCTAFNAYAMYQLSALILKNFKGIIKTAYDTHLFLYPDIWLSENGSDLNGLCSFGSGVKYLVINNIENGYANNIREIARENAYIEYIPYFKVINANASRAFDRCSNLVYCNVTGDITAGNRIFAECINLKEHGLLDFTNSAGNNDAFLNCKSLKKVNIVENSINKSISFQNCISFTTEELNRIFTECLADLTGQDAQTITITGAGGASECDVTIAQSKNWTVVR